MKVTSVLRWYSIYSDRKPKIGDECLISDDDGNISVAIYAYLKKEYCFYNISSGTVERHVYCWAKLPELLSDKQLDKINKEIK